MNAMTTVNARHAGDARRFRPKARRIRRVGETKVAAGRAAMHPRS
ncbi:hypothetical protein [Burkholderia plantarii]|nr:hypothetical protein [Burkholderia plantarii]